MAKSKLLAALAAEKGTDFKKLKEKRNAKQNRKERRAAVQKPQLKGGAKAVEDADSEDEEEGDLEEAEDGSDGSAPELFDMEAEESDEDDDEDEEDEDQGVRLGAIDDSESDSEVEMEEKIARPAKPSPKPSKSPASKKKPAPADSDDEDEEDEEDDDVAWSDLESLPDSEKEDLIRHQRETINNTRALLASLNRIRLPTLPPAPFASHMSLSAATEKPTSEAVPDPQDDLARELHFYSQSLDSAKRARDLLKKEGVPFTRPVDYFADMVKDDGHMEKIKAKLVEEASAKKASAEARKQRDLKKFGKQVQVAKLQERAKEKRNTLEKIKDLKRKRQESTSDLPSREADLFDVSVETELKSHTNRTSSKSSRGGRDSSSRNPDGRPNPKRLKKDAKFGFGGKKKHAKSNDAESAADMSGYSARVNGNARGGGRGGRGGRGGFGGAGRGGRGGAKPRLGKARRASAGRK